MSMNVSSASQSTPVTAQTPARSQSAKPEGKQQQTAQEKVSIGGQKTEGLTYSKPRAMPESLATMLEDSDRKVQEMLDLIRPLIEQQGLTMAKVASGEQKLTVDQKTIDDAKAAISEDGEWGVRKVAERILSFAKFQMNDDPAQLQKIRDAVELGFSQAKEVLGGELPEISQQTYDTIMAEFDRWEKEGIPQGDTVSLAKSADADSKAAKVQQKYT
ncbi:hypothetical protein SAMN05660284_00344 [Formivibrio citricus]|uniref:DUF5610 domain-containing protein n=1 Tax=Formivibrio citricus TaxID=83765 RepID=A0A1I4VS72_9NEIS|nr:hypothetical protein [Formivibrio citricus]SFN03806.1 hypothetical protein SAMN05660284_00344 [Formivibrio citricus]